MENTIWCFWEPKAALPDYLKLCMQTWHKLGREIILLDNSNLSQYLSKKELRLLNKTRSYYTLPQQADAIRVMILHRYGGMWMDVDTIILKPDEFIQIEQAKQHTEVLMIECHIGWIWASQSSQLMLSWYKALRDKLNFKKYHKKHNVTIEWDYLGNSIVNDLIVNATSAEYFDLSTVMPYSNFVPESTAWIGDASAVDKPAIYQNFYFSKQDNTEHVNNSIFIQLHNSWTPQKFKEMSEAEFLQTDTTLAKILQGALDE